MSEDAAEAPELAPEDPVAEPVPVEGPDAVVAEIEPPTEPEVAEAPVEPEAPTHRTCQVTEAGADEIFTGEMVGGRELKHPFGATFLAPIEQALALFERGLVDLLD